MSTPDNNIELLERLSALLEKGLLSREEFEREKKKILGVPATGIQTKPSPEAEMKTPVTATATMAPPIQTGAPQPNPYALGGQVSNPAPVVPQGAPIPPPGSSSRTKRFPVALVTGLAITLVAFIVIFLGLNSSRRSDSPAPEAMQSSDSLTVSSEAAVGEIESYLTSYDAENPSALDRNYPFKTELGKQFGVLLVKKADLDQWFLEKLDEKTISRMYLPSEIGIKAKRDKLRSAIKDVVGSVKHYNVNHAAIVSEITNFYKEKLGKTITPDYLFTDYLNEELTTSWSQAMMKFYDFLDRSKPVLDKGKKHLLFRTQKQISEYKRLVKNIEDSTAPLAERLSKMAGS